MTVYGYVAIIEVSLKLIVVYLLGIVYYDKLKIYALLMFFSQVTISSFYVFYSRKNFKECRLAFYWNKSKMREILSFSMWSMMGTLAGAMRSQGLNVLINLFFNPAINAARGIAFQMQAAVNGLRVNFYNAVSPRVTKLYSSEHHEEMMGLVFMSSKLAFFLIMFFSIPMLIETPYILHLWLGTVPEYSILFTRLVIIELTIDIFNNPLDNALGASGRVRQFQIWVSSLLLLIVPLSYLALKVAEYPEIPFVISILVSILCFFPRLYFVHKFVALPVRQYLWKVVFVSYRVLIIASLPPLICYVMMEEDDFYRLIVVCITSCISSGICIYWLGLNLPERTYVKKYVAKLPFVKSL
jgi:O-antigen/teichoic acid export membrane protein